VRRQMWGGSPFLFFFFFFCRNTHILAVLHSNGADVESVDLSVRVAQVKDIHATTATGDKGVSSGGDLVLDGLLLHDLDEGWAGCRIVPRVDTFLPKGVPAV